MSHDETTRYAPRVLRGPRGERYALLSLALASACGAAPSPAYTSAHAEPLPVSENQQGRREPTETVAVEEDIGPLPTDQPSIAGVYLWCQTPRGPGCRLASAALGTGPKDATGLPASLQTVEDRSNDCEERTIASVSGRLDHAFAVQTSGWRDQGGNHLDLSLLGDMYQAAGCINDADPSHPIAKISAADGTNPRLYLVRIWDRQLP
jgi:hypothetical protein